MPLDGAELLAAAEALVACQRLAAQLPHLAAWLDHAASRARVDWTGSHRESFDHRVTSIERALLEASATLNVLHARIDAQVQVAPPR